MRGRTGGGDLGETWRTGTGEPLVRWVHRAIAMTYDRRWLGRTLLVVGALVSCDMPSSVDIRSDAPTSTVPGLAPDLTWLWERMEASIVIRSELIDGSSCALDECLTAFGVRTLLRFETAAFNAGTAAMVLGPPQPSQPQWDHDSCELTDQFLDFASYQVVDAQGAVVAVGHRRSFCVRDDIEVTPGAPSSGFDCQSQGLSPGWAQIYPNHLDCQFVDITDVAPGNYLLRVELNPERRITEASYTNNVATFPVVIE